MHTERTKKMLYGFDIGGTKIEFGAFDETKSLKEYVATERIETPTDDYEALLDAIVRLVHKYNRQLKCRCPRIGLGIPGIEDADTGVLMAANIPSANGQKLREDLESKLNVGDDDGNGSNSKNVQVKIENDANCFALSEAYALKENTTINDANESSPSSPPPSVLGIILGTGVGAGFIVDGKAFGGRNNMTGEFGHSRLPIDAWFHLVGSGSTDEAEPPPLFDCGCGRKGCIDNYISGRGFEMLYSHYNHNGKKKAAIEIIDEYNQQEIKTPNLNKIVEHVERFMELLAIIFANLFSTLDPHVVVLGGGLSNFELIYEELPKRISKYLLPNAKCPKIIQAKYGDSGGGVRGAAFLNL